MTRWRSSARLAVTGAVLLVTLITIGDVLEGPDPQVVATVVVGPLLAAAFARPRAVAGVAAYTLIISVIHSLIGGFAGTVPQAVRLVSIALASLLAVAVAVGRQRQQRAAAELAQWQSIAGVAQRTIIRDLPAHLDGVGAAGRYISAHSLAGVGGDFYEVLPTPFGVRAVIGDVRGKGLEAVQLAAHCLGCFRESVFRDADLASVARAMDAVVRREAAAEDFVTAALVQFSPDRDRVLVVNAGHPPPLMMDGDSCRELVAGYERPLGLGASPTVGEWFLPGGARVLLYTDGATEARREGRFFPFEAAVVAAGTASTGPADWLDGIEARLAEFTGDRFSDDIALLALTRADVLAAAAQPGPVVPSRR